MLVTEILLKVFNLLQWLSLELDLFEMRCCIVNYETGTHFIGRLFWSTSVLGSHYVLSTEKNTNIQK